jgi:hypothetical protein
MLNDDDIIGKVKIAILIGIVVAAVMSCGCVSLPSSDASPSEIVETFASWHGAEEFEACYEYLMSEEYRNSTDESTFKEKMSQCKPDYEFVEVRSEKIDGDSALVEVVYAENVVEIKYQFPLNLIDKISDNKPNSKTKTINLTKEEEGWRLTNLHCELKGK